MKKRIRSIGSYLTAAIAGAVIGLLSVYVFIASDMPEPRPWHEPMLAKDFGEDEGDEELQAYLEREERLFSELSSKIAELAAEDGVSEGQQAANFNRFLPASPSNPANHPKNWNRSFVFEVDAPLGGVVLVHGLTDSPYSVRALGELFRELGFYTVGLRVPGHGTLPGELLRTNWRDWRAAVNVAARHVERKVGPERPFVMVGYSNGGALVSDYALRSLETKTGLTPDLLVLVTPSMGVSAIAGLARFQRRLAKLPGLGSLAWTSILPEFDPYKYNSFPVAAGEQIHLLTSDLEARLSAAASNGDLLHFPAVLAFQSVADATLPAKLVVDRLMARLPPSTSELVLFDVNRVSKTDDLLKPAYVNSLQSLLQAPELGFKLTIVTNENPESPEVVARVRQVGSPSDSDSDSWQASPLELRWPRGIFSLSHVALPIPPEDAIYGVGGSDDDPTHLRMGTLELRGERGVLKVPLNTLLRLRYNPFYPFLEQRVKEWVARVDRG